MPPSGYAWWYFDGLSDDQTLSITLIAFVGSVFSPFYARARRGGGVAYPDDFCAMNVVLRGPGLSAWALTEWPRGTVRRDRDRLDIGSSALRWVDERSLDVRFVERGVPFPGRIEGTLRLHADALFGSEPVALDAEGRHAWSPVAPVASFEASIDRPRAVRFRGRAYHDANVGLEPLETAFASWTWSRAVCPRGTTVLYDVQRREAQPLLHGRFYGTDGRSCGVHAPHAVTLPAGRWGVQRATRCAAGARLVATLLDAPFYVRSHITMDLETERLAAMHESLSLDRFANPVVQAMLRLRTRRRR